MSVEWGNAIETGIKWQDTQHLELLKILAALGDAIKVGCKTEDVKKIVISLDEYAIKHFAMEERFMTRYSYKEYLAHKLEHKNFTEVIDSLKMKIEEEGINFQTLTSLHSHLVTWYVSHVSKADVKLGRFLKSNLSPHEQKMEIYFATRSYLKYKHL